MTVAAMRPTAVMRCARSAQMRPRSMSRSLKVPTCAEAFARREASRRRATRCWAVSAGVEPEEGVKAWGPVGVKRVASAMERGAMVRVGWGAGEVNGSSVVVGGGRQFSLV